MAKIAIDADGVLANFITGFVEEVNKMWPGKIPDADRYWETRHTQWNFAPELLTKQEVNAVWKKIDQTENWWLTLRAHFENVGALAVFLHTHYDNEVWIVTSRQVGAGMTISQQTELWLRACGVEWPHNYLGVIPVSNSDDKQLIYRCMDIQFSVDDKKETVEQCDQIPGHKAFLMDRAWNKDTDVKRRVTSLTQYFEQIA